MTDTDVARRATRAVGQTVVVIGGARASASRPPDARAEGADVILTGRDHDASRRPRPRSTRRASRPSTPPTSNELGTFFDELPTPIDHVLVTGPGPYYAPLADFDLDAARRDVEAHLLLPMQVARHAAGTVRPGGTLLFMSGTGGRRTAPGFALIVGAHRRDAGADQGPRARDRAGPREPDRRRVRRHAAVGGAPRRRAGRAREQLRTTLPIRRVVGPADVAALAVHLMANTAVTGATYDIDGGQQLVPG